MRLFIATLFVFFSLASGFLAAQTPLNREDFVALYEQEKFEDALRIINKNLDAIYETRLDDKKVPTDFISMRSDKEDIDLNRVFYERKAKGFFIEENPELVKLHVYAAACYAALRQHREAISNYTQALRFKLVKPREDDIIYYAMAQVYKESDQFDGYIRALESAFSLNPEKYAYSLEIATALAPTVKKVKALYHLERYLNNTDDDFNPKLYVLAGNLSEDIGYYLNTEAYYQKYLDIEDGNGAVYFALGYIAYAKTGNHKLAAASFESSLSLLPENDIYRRSKANEYIADMALKNLEFRKAIEYYSKTLDYQKQVLAQINQTNERINELSARINELKYQMLKEHNYTQFSEYESLEEERGKLRLILSNERHQYEILNGGIIRWNIAWAHERLEEYPEAISFYREVISFDYRPNDAREKIVKLQLKIKRGY